MSHNKQFWGLEVEPGKVYTLEEDLDLLVTQIALGASAKTKERNIVHCKVGGGDFVLGSVQLGSTEQFPLNAFFEKGKPVEFYVEGRHSVHLTGVNLVETNSQNEQKPEQKQQQTAQTQPEPQIKQQKNTNGNQSNPKSQATTPQTSSLKEEPQAEPVVEAMEESVQSQEEPKKTTKQGPQRVEAKTPAKRTIEEASAELGSPSTPAKRPTSAPSTTPKQKSGIQTLHNGLIIEDLMEGIGKQTSPGHKVTVHYVGKLHPSGQKFDSGRNFSFRLGTQQVIKGWDIGLKGMKVGGKRTLIVPPALGYGKAGYPPVIPPNATLHFEIELVEA